MNAQRLLTIAKKLHSEFTGLKVVATVNQLVQQLQEAINTPNEANQRAVETTLKQLVEKLSTAESNLFSPGLREELEELKINATTPVSNLIGSGLAYELDEAITEGFTSVLSLDRLRQISKDLQVLATALEQIINSYKALGIPDEAIEPGQSIVGMLIPRDAINNNLRELQHELGFLSRFLRDLTECLEGSHDDIKVYSIHASELGIDVLSTLQVAAWCATIITAVRGMLEKLLEYRKAKEQVEKLGVGKDVVDKITDKGRRAVDEKIDQIKTDIFQHCKLDDKGRISELKTSIKMDLEGLAYRLERGFMFEVRTALPPDAPEETTKMASPIQAFTTVRFDRLEGTSLLEPPQELENDIELELEEKAKTKRTRTAKPSKAD